MNIKTYKNVNEILGLYKEDQYWIKTLFPLYISTMGSPICSFAHILISYVSHFIKSVTKEGYQFKVLVNYNRM